MKINSILDQSIPPSEFFRETESTDSLLLATTEFCDKKETSMTLKEEKKNESTGMIWLKGLNPLMNKRVKADSIGKKEKYILRVRHQDADLQK